MKKGALLTLVVSISTVFLLTIWRASDISKYLIKFTTFADEYVSQIEEAASDLLDSNEDTPALDSATEEESVSESETSDDEEEEDPLEGDDAIEEDTADNEDKSEEDIAVIESSTDTVDSSSDTPEISEELSKATPLSSTAPVVKSGGGPPIVSWVATTLYISMFVINDDGGTATPNDFNVRLNGELISFIEDNGLYITDYPLTEGMQYTLTVDNLPGYTIGDWVCQELKYNTSTDYVDIPFIFGGDTEISCLLISDDRSQDALSKLKIIRESVDLSGYGIRSQDFRLNFEKDSIYPVASFWGSATGTERTIESGAYNIVTYYPPTDNVKFKEMMSPNCLAGVPSGQDFYTNDHTFVWSLTLSPGEQKTCTSTAIAYPMISILPYMSLVDSSNHALPPSVLANNRDTFQVIIENTSTGTQEVLSMGIKDNYAQLLSYQRLYLKGLDEGTYKIIPVQKNGYHIDSCTPKRAQVNPNGTFVAEDLGDYDISCVAKVLDTSELGISKTNDSPSRGIQPGKDVNYSIKLEAPVDEKDGKYVVKNIIVGDKLPPGFTYKSGSWRAVSSLRGVLNLSEPVYKAGEWANWSLGDIVEGENITLTYTAHIPSDLSAGVYSDEMWVSGASVLGVQIVGDVGGGSEFAKTEVKVLGSASSLPATGSSSWFTILGILSITVGSLALLPTNHFKMFVVIRKR